MAIARENFLNLEKSTAFFFAGLVLLLAYFYGAGRPASIGAEIEARPPRAALGADAVLRASSTRPAETEQLVSGRDIFVPKVLETAESYALAKVVAPNNNPPVVVAKSNAEALPKKPETETKIETVEPTPTTAETKELPLKVYGLVKNGDTRKVVVAPKDDPLKYQILGEGEEWTDGKSNGTVIAITFTSASFRDADGKTYLVDLDPMQSWKPLLEAAEQAGPAETAAPQDKKEKHPELAAAAKTNDAGQHTPEILQQLQNGKVPDQKDIESALEKLKNSNAELKNKLGEIF